MNAREQILRDEGYKDHLYYDHGVPHIGVGCNLVVPVSLDICSEITITPSARERLFDVRILTASKDLYGHLPWVAHLDEVRRAALVNLVFNMGIGNFLGKNHEAVQALQRGDYETFRALMLGKSWQAVVGDRAVRICNQIVTGQWM